MQPKSNKKIFLKKFVQSKSFNFLFRKKLHLVTNRIFINISKYNKIIKKINVFNHFPFFFKE